MTIEVHSKSKGSIIYKNVKLISTGVDYVDGRPVFLLRLTQINHSEDINIDDVIGFSIYDAPATWIDNATDIVCPHCGQNYDFEIFHMAHSVNIKDDKIMNFCPKCGNKVDVDSYFNDTIKE